MRQGSFTKERDRHCRSFPGPVASGEVQPLEADVIEVRLAFTEMFRIAGVGAYHTSITFGGVEYSFNFKGIVCRPPFASHNFASQGTRVQIYRFGSTMVSGRALLDSLDPFFEAGTYDLFYKNCNSFVDAALYFLFRERLDPQYSRFERLLGAGGPFTTGVIKRVSAAAGLLDESTDRYVANPRALDFCLEDVILACDSMRAGCCRHAVAPSSVGLVTLCCCAPEDEASGAEHIQAEEMQSDPSNTSKLVTAKSSKERTQPVRVPPRVGPRVGPQITACGLQHVKRHRRRLCLV